MRYIFLVLVFLIPFNGNSQIWKISQHLKCDNDLRILDIKKDINSNIYAAGIFKGSFNNNLSVGDYDIFIAKLKSDFTIEWVQTVGGVLAEADPRIIIDNANNIFLTGAFQDSCVFENSSYLKSTGGYDIFLAKYSTNGDLIWTKDIASFLSVQRPTDIDVDNSNNLIITGHYTDSIYFIDQKIVSTGKNNFYAKVDTSGSKIWIKNIRCSLAASRIANVKVYQNEYYFNGYFRDTMYFDIKTITSNLTGKQDIFIYKTDINGNGLWIRRTFGNGLDLTGSIAGDNYGNIYSTGYYKSSSVLFDSTASFKNKNALLNYGSSDIFISKYNKTGTLLWIKRFGDVGEDYGIDIDVKNNILYISGYFSGSISFDGLNLYSSGTSDADMFLTSMEDRKSVV